MLDYRSVTCSYRIYWTIRGWYYKDLMLPFSEALQCSYNENSKHCKTRIAPKKWWLGDEFRFGMADFQSKKLVLGTLKIFKTVSNQQLQNPVAIRNLKQKNAKKRGCKKKRDQQLPFIFSNTTNPITSFWFSKKKSCSFSLVFAAEKKTQITIPTLISVPCNLGTFEVPETGGLAIFPIGLVVIYNPGRFLIEPEHDGLGRWCEFLWIWGVFEKVNICRKSSGGVSGWIFLEESPSCIKKLWKMQKWWHDI